jgi:transposase
MDTSTVPREVSDAVDTLGRRVARRRHRPIEEKRAIVEASLQSGASVAEVARRYEVNANQVFAWRRLYAQGLLEQHSRRMSGRKLVPIKLLESVSSPADVAPVCSVSPVPGTLTIELPSGARVAVNGCIDAALFTQALSLLLR